VAPCITILETLLLLLLHMLHMLLLHMLLLRMLLLALLRMLLHMLRMRMLLLLQELHMLPCKLLLLLMLRLKSSLFCFKISFFVCFASPGHGHRKPISHGTAPQRHRTWPTNGKLVGSPRTCTGRSKEYSFIRKKESRFTLVFSIRISRIKRTPQQPKLDLRLSVPVILKHLTYSLLFLSFSYE
jgi:hypothetical protein